MSSVKVFARLWAQILLAFIFTQIGLASFAQTPVNFDALEQTALAELQETKTPGAAVAIVKDNRVVFVKGFGVANVETSAPLAPETLFHIGSLAKMMTAAALVSLAEEGKVDLNAPVGNYLKNLNPKIAALTLHRLLSQTSGLRDIAGETGMQDETSLAAFAASLGEKDLLFEPGKYFSYSNAGFALAGAVLEKAQGKMFADAMNERIFAPLEMSRTTFRPTQAMTYPLAVGHTIDKAGKAQVVRPFSVNTSLSPAGYVYSSVNDFANFITAVLNQGKFKEKQIFPAKTASQLLTAHVEIPTNVFNNGKYGYGFFLQNYRGYQVAEHGGTQTGFSSEVKIVAEERFAVIVFANRDAVRLNKTFAKAFDIFLPVTKSAETNAPQGITMTAAEMESYVGTYVNRWSMDIFVRDGKLYLRRFGTELPITKIGKNRFSVTPAPGAPSQEFTIDFNAARKVEALRMFLWAFKKQ